MRWKFFNETLDSIKKEAEWSSNNALGTQKALISIEAPAFLRNKGTSTTKKQIVINVTKLKYNKKGR